MRGKEDATNQALDALKGGLKWKAIDVAGLMALVSQDIGVVTIGNIRQWQGGSYALKLCPRYLADSFRGDSALQLRVAKLQDTTCIKVSGIVSRYRSGIKRTAVLRLGKFGDGGALVGACSCPSGARSIGGCAHVVFVLWLFVQLLETHLKERTPYNEIIVNNLVRKTTVSKPRKVVDHSSFSRKRRAGKKILSTPPPRKTVYQAVVIEYDTSIVECEAYDEENGDFSDEEAFIESEAEERDSDWEEGDE